MAKTLGHHMLEDVIPAGYRPEGVYTRGALYKSMLRLAKDDPELYATIIPQVKAVGDELATMEGISVGLDDIAPIHHARDAIMNPAIKAFEAATTRKQRQDVVSATQSKMVDYAKTHPGTMGDMARSGGRGNMIQLMKAVGSPVAANDEKDRVQPWLIRTSYSEGLRPADFWAANREARMAAAKSTIEVSEPGDLSKIIASNVMHVVVTQHDCGTHNGIYVPADTGALDRYLAKDGHLVTQGDLRKWRADNTTSVMVRSPMTCEAKKGVCQLCMGHDVTGKLNLISTNVGVRAAHAIGEPSVQLVLNAKHGVRTAGGVAGATGIAALRAVLESPETFKGRAALAPVNGTVQSITKAPQGGHYFIVGDERVHALEGHAARVAVGDRVHAGDALSEGVPKPDEVVKHKGLGAGRTYLVNQMQRIYGDAGIDVDRRHYEILAKSLLNHLDVTHADPNAHGIVRGDTITFNQFEAATQKAKKTVPTADALGRVLAGRVLEHLPGTAITEGLQADLKRHGVHEIPVSTLDVKFEPIMAAATRNPLLNPDVFARLGHRYLKQSVTEGAARGDFSDLSGTHPIPAMIWSPSFGEGHDGGY